MGAGLPKEVLAISPALDNTCSMTIEQIVEITADRQLTIDIPPDVPEGRARIEVRVVRLAEKEEGRDGMPGQEPDNRRGHLPLVESLSGILSEQDLDKFAAEDERARYILRK